MGSTWGIRWTEERTAQFRKLHAEGLSFGRIAARLGITRGACAGKAMRMGLLKDDARSSLSKDDARSSLSKDDARSRPKVERGPLQFTAPMPNGANIPIAQRCTLLQLKPGICKWPFGEPQSPDFFFCGGNAVDGFPYCAGHCRVAYRLRAA